MTRRRHHSPDVKTCIAGSWCSFLDCQTVRNSEVIVYKQGIVDKERYLLCKIYWYYYYMQYWLHKIEFVIRLCNSPLYRLRQGSRCSYVCLHVMICVMVLPQISRHLRVMESCRNKPSVVRKLSQHISTVC